MSKNISLVRWYPELEKHRCGYCKETNSNCSYGMWAESLTVEDYQYLIDRGWRRSGKYCYKPVMDVTCCPLYTIRCEALNLKVSKSQKKIIKRVNRYLSDLPPTATTDKDETLACFVGTDALEADARMDSMAMAVDHGKLDKTIDLGKLDSDQINMIISNRIDNDNALIDDNDTYTPKQSSITSISSDVDKSGEKYKLGKGADPSKPPCKKAKVARLERKQQKLAAKGLTLPQSQSNTSTNAQPAKSLEQLIEDISKTPVHKLKVRLVLTGGKKDWSEIKAQEYEVYKRYQMAIHGDPADKCTERQFQSFLLESPLQHISGGPDCGYGSFHQQYWLDEKLIAVGVVDVLPKCVSSVYFFYDPDYRNLTLGTYGSLRELYFVRKLCEQVAAIKYYYLGFYIHSCPKMRYKASFAPSYLLCPETYVWFPMDHCLPKLNQQKYCRFNEDTAAQDRNGCSSLDDLDALMILDCRYKGCVPFKYLKDKIHDHQHFIRFGNLIGKKCIPRILMVASYDS